MASIFDFTTANDNSKNKNSPSPGSAYNTYSDSNPIGLYMSTPVDAMEEYGDLNSEVLHDNNIENQKSPLKKIYQRMTPDRNKKHKVTESRRYQYQTQEKSDDGVVGCVSSGGPRSA